MTHATSTVNAGKFVQQLRAWPACERHDAFSSTYVGELLSAAADEIERLSRLAQQMPDGWKLVPVTPTRKMIDRGYATRPIEECWRVMLEAAPTPALPSTDGTTHDK